MGGYSKWNARKLLFDDGRDLLLDDRGGLLLNDSSEQLLGDSGEFIVEDALNIMLWQSPSPDALSRSPARVQSF